MAFSKRMCTYRINFNELWSIKEPIMPRKWWKKSKNNFCNIWPFRSINKKKKAVQLNPSFGIMSMQWHILYTYTPHYICEESGAQRLTDAEIKLTPIRTIAQQYKIFAIRPYFLLLYSRICMLYGTGRKKERDTHTESEMEQKST